MFQIKIYYRGDFVPKFAQGEYHEFGNAKWYADYLAAALSPPRKTEVCFDRIIVSEAGEARYVVTTTARWVVQRDVALKV